MHAVVPTDIGTLELNWLHLPTWIGINTILKKEMEGQLAAKIEGLPINEEGLQQAHDIVVDYLEERFPKIKGLREQIDALKYLELLCPRTNASICA